MLISLEKTNLGGSTTLAFRENDEKSDRDVKDSRQNSIPSRYKDGRGGIDLEQIRLDQRRARQEVVRALIRRLLGTSHLP